MRKDASIRLNQGFGDVFAYCVGKDAIFPKLAKSTQTHQPHI